MKNFVVTVFAAAAMIACKKNETVPANHSAESMGVSAPAETGMVVSDSTKMPGTAAHSLSDHDKKFADAAAKGGLMEVMMGKLAATNASNSVVKSLGAMMVTDHSKANDELKKWAEAAGYTLPTALDAEKQKMYDDLKAKKGVDFDRKYTDLMVTDHKEDIEEFRKEAENGKETSLKSFASRTLPTLEHHLKESEKAKAAVK
ncbi:MAG: DUF4142 domain-containing protein [Chryseobacterium sp.]|uniref:DUF4142 domain-containing protein n=1 Tax=Chryseobacterium sp. TaxID=1871047 RepID=UPI0025C2453B|nr:DUF4142 domain-containing protein [Chryseobacterium sp.]MCJ7932326.1 DUF4142 domain-containing protein [Chryseobacterium sp.]